MIEKIMRKSAEGGIYMRIEAYTNVQQIYNSKNTAKLKKEKTHSFSDICKKP